MSDTGVVLDVIEPTGHIHVLLLLLDGQIHLSKNMTKTPFKNTKNSVTREFVILECLMLKDSCRKKQKQIAHCCKIEKIR